ncbi:MAG: aminotransferase class V-fold PLP-dependent enzyme [Pseudomonadota bacterium]
MITCQRDQFDIPDEISYLSAASYAPLPNSVREAGHVGVERKGRPWLVTASDRKTINEEARAAAAALMSASPDCIGLIPSVSYGITTAAHILPVAAGTRILVLENDHASPVLAWHARAEAGGYTVETIATPANGDWTSAVRDAIARPGAPPVSIASISLVHWSDGCLLDMATIAEDLHRQDAKLVVDATQAIGAMPVDVATFDPDVLVFPTYKWVLGPYGRAFVYVAERHHDAHPVEQAAPARSKVSSEDLPYFEDLAYRETARRFDMAELDHYITMDMATTGMRFVGGLGPDNVSTYIGALTEALAARLDGPRVPDARFRTPHILSLDVGVDRAKPAATALAARGIHVAARLGRLRVAPHIYNDQRDIDRIATALTEIL